MCKVFLRRIFLFFQSIGTERECMPTKESQTNTARQSVKKPRPINSLRIDARLVSAGDGYRVELGVTEKDLNAKECRRLSSWLSQAADYMESKKC
jgi:hypothetical protein